ncbi:hypothetical protein GQ55_4G043400 [Panicum hallii var. hallii]|uniref:Uncharacterized protein n=1 Tax=Panicum hallii var. hallii TaxID=1504633 RepID=A0A2T7DV68_9POAL|nr:hypothetical protein GQ55_4G043400 [Panicum hallii var. hallii]
MSSSIPMLHSADLVGASKERVRGYVHSLLLTMQSYRWTNTVVLRLGLRPGQVRC